MRFGSERRKPTEYEIEENRKRLVYERLKRESKARGAEA